MEEVKLLRFQGRPQNQKRATLPPPPAMIKDTEKAALLWQEYKNNSTFFMVEI